MKLIENQDLSRLSATIAGYHNLHRVIARLELYSCKMAGYDKKMYKQLLGSDETMQDLEWLSPSALSPPTTSFHRDQVSKKTLYYLRATLNVAYYPEYDFTDAKSTEFTREPSYEFVRRNIESIKTRQFDDLNLGKAILMPSLGSDYEEVRSNLWLSLEKEIKPHECEIYSYCGDGQSDPWNDSGCIWNFVYFFYNKQTKQVLYFACEGLSPTAQIHDDENMEELPDDIMFDDPMSYGFSEEDRSMSLQSEMSVF